MAFINHKRSKNGIEFALLGGIIFSFFFFCPAREEKILSSSFVLGVGGMNELTMVALVVLRKSSPPFSLVIVLLIYRNVLCEEE